MSTPSLVGSSPTSAFAPVVLPSSAGPPPHPELLVTPSSEQLAPVPIASLSANPPIIFINSKPYFVCQYSGAALTHRVGLPIPNGGKGKGSTKLLGSFGDNNRLRSWLHQQCYTHNRISKEVHSFWETQLLRYVTGRVDVETATELINYAPDASKYHAAIGGTLSESQFTLNYGFKGHTQPPNLVGAESVADALSRLSAKDVKKAEKAPKKVGKGGGEGGGAAASSKPPASGYNLYQQEGAEGQFKLVGKAPTLEKAITGLFAAGSTAGAAHLTYLPEKRTWTASVFPPYVPPAAVSFLANATNIDTDTLMPVSIQREVELTLTNTPLILVPRNKDRVLANRKREALKEKKEQKQAKKEAAKASAAKGKEKGKEKGKKVGKASKNGAKGHARSGGENKKAPLALIPTTIPKADPAPGTSAAPVIPAAPVNITPTSTKTSSNNKRKAADKVSHKIKPPKLVKKAKAHLLAAAVEPVAHMPAPMAVSS